MEKRKQQIQIIKRRSSLNSLKELKEEEEEQEEDEESGENSNDINSLKSLEKISEVLTNKCNKHEQTILSLENEIEQKLRDWSSTIITLQKLDDTAQGLTDQIRSTLENIRSTPSMQITASKISTKNVRDRKNFLKDGFEISLRKIESGLKGLDRLEKILVQEEGTLVEEGKWGGRVLLVFTYTLGAGSIAVLAWYYRNCFGVV